jgi:hypothetical protein
VRVQSAGRPVYVIGDSVMLGAQAAVVAALAPLPATVDAQESRSLLGAVSLLQEHRAEMGDVVVVALGTNDGTDPGEFAHRIDLAMGALQGVAHVLWVNQRQFAPGRAEMNSVLASATARYPNLTVLDWNAAVDANPAAVGPDGIHLTDVGRALMAGLVANAVHTALTPPTTTTTTTTSTMAPVTTAAAASNRRAAGNPGAAHRDGSGGDFPVVPVAAGAAVLVAGAAVLAVRRRRRDEPRSG